MPNDKYIKSPYNTYQNEGLPPTPIANPSPEAILPALNPKQTDCMLFQSENFQALGTLSARYRSSTSIIFADPPYNTGVDGFPYKDTYQHSSWLSMIEDRLSLARNLLSKAGLAFLTIDYVEVSRLRLLCDALFGGGHVLADIALEKW